MEKIISDIINAGIAVFKSGEDGVKKAISDMEKLYNELKTKGETDKSEQAAQLRELLNKTIRDSKEILDRADSSYKEVINNLQTNFDTISQQIEQVVPEQVKSTVKTGFDELRKLIGPKKV